MIYLNCLYINVFVNLEPNFNTIFNIRLIYYSYLISLRSDRV